MMYISRLSTSDFWEVYSFREHVFYLFSIPAVICLGFFTTSSQISSECSADFQFHSSIVILSISIIHPLAWKLNSVHSSITRWWHQKFVRITRTDILNRVSNILKKSFSQQRYKNWFSGQLNKPYCVFNSTSLDRSFMGEPWCGFFA